MDLSKIDVEINPEYTMKKKVNGSNLYLSQEEIDILKSYDIDCMKYNSLNDLLYDLENIEDEINDDVLTNVIDALAERNYYENFKK